MLRFRSEMPIALGAYMEALGRMIGPFSHPMRPVLITQCVYLVASCAPSRPMVDAPASRITAAAPATGSSICGGYEDILAMPGRPFTPCEVDTQTEMSRRPILWPVDHAGPCQFVELQVVVDSLGRLEPGSPSILRTNVPGTASNAVRELGNTQFRPGRKGGIPVRQVRRYVFLSPGPTIPCHRGTL